MDTSAFGNRHVGDVNDKVADLAEEVVLVGVPLGAITARNVRIGVDDSKTFKVGQGFDDRKVSGVANELGVVVLDDRLADTIDAGREVDESGSNGRRVAAIAASIASGDSCIDRLRVV